LLTQSSRSRWESKDRIFSTRQTDTRYFPRKHRTESSLVQRLPLSGTYSSIKSILRFSIRIVPKWMNHPLNARLRLTHSAVLPRAVTHAHKATSKQFSLSLMSHGVPILLFVNCQMDRPIKMKIDQTTPLTV